MENLLEFRVLHGTLLKNAVSVISKIADKALVLINKEGLSILVRDQENEGAKLIVILRLRKTGCSHYQFQFHASYGDVGISLSLFQDILNNVTEQESVSISVKGNARNVLEVDFINSVTSELRNFPMQVIPFNAQEYPYNAPMVIPNEAAFTVTASIPSERFCDILRQLRYERGPDNALIDTHAPVDIFILRTSTLACESSGRKITLEQENGEFTIEGATDDDVFYLRFPLVQLNAFVEAARLSDTVFIHAKGEDLPLLNCPYGEDHLGSLLFVGESSTHLGSDSSEE